MSILRSRGPKGTAGASVTVVSASSSHDDRVGDAIVQAAMSVRVDEQAVDQPIEQADEGNQSWQGVEHVTHPEDASEGGARAVRADDLDAQQGFTNRLCAPPDQVGRDEQPDERAEERD